MVLAPTEANDFSEIGLIYEDPLKYYIALAVVLLIALGIAGGHFAR